MTRACGRWPWRTPPLLGPSPLCHTWKRW